MPRPLRFTPEQARTLLKAYQNGWSIKCLARYFEANKQTIARAIDRAADAERLERASA